MKMVELVLTAVLAASGALPAFASEVHQFDIPAEAAAVAIRDFGTQAHVQILVAGEAVSGKRLHAVTGELSTEDGLNRLLSGSGLTHQYVGDRSIALVSAAAATSLRTQEPRPADKGDDSQPRSSLQLAQATPGQTSSPVTVEKQDEQVSRQKPVVLEEVLVTGTHIQGAKETAAPSIAISREDLAKTGYSTLGEVFADLPQNLNEISPVAYQAPNASRAADLNYLGATGISLRGLGAESTLTLVNGQRQPATVLGRVVDVSAIPLAAVERVEIVNGGGSAIYGSDAVAGVVNIVTRRDFDGAETQFSYGGAEHGDGQLDFSQLFGKKFSRGGFMIAYDYKDTTKLDVVDTGVTTPQSLIASAITLHQDIVPERMQHSGVFAGHLSPADNVEITADGLYSRENSDYRIDLGIPGTTGLQDFSGVYSEQYSASAGLHIKVSPSWTIDTVGNFGEVHSSRTLTETAFFLSSPILVANAATSILRSASLIANGSLFSLGNNDVRTAIGAEARTEDFESLENGVPNYGPGARTIRSAFAEFLVPLVENGETPGLRRLELSIAGRYDKYSDFGHTFNPQGGLIWKPTDELTVRGAYSRAFRAPYFDTLQATTGAQYVFRPDPSAASGNSPVLYAIGGNPNLQPERANTWTVGVDFKPEFITNATVLSVDYYNIDYKGRIDFPAQGDDLQLFLQRPTEFAGLITRNPSAAQIDSVLALANTPTLNFTGTSFDVNSGAAALAALPGLVIFDNRYANVAKEVVQGIDFQWNTKCDTRVGMLSYRMNAAYQFKHDRSVTSSSPAFSLLNTPGKPVNLRLRAETGWTKGPLGGFVYMNYVNHYTDDIATPPVPIASWTTFDMTLRFDGTSSPSSGVRGLTAALSAENLFDRRPPQFLSSDTALGFDGANTNPIGRVVSLRVTKRW